MIEWTHISKSSGHLGFTKTKNRLEAFHWRHKSRDFNLFTEAFKVCQQLKNHSGKTLGDSTVLEISDRRWDMASSDFITGLPTSKTGYDAVTIISGCLSRRVHFVACTKCTGLWYYGNSVCQFFKMGFLHNMDCQSVYPVNRDVPYLSKLWQELLIPFAISIKMSSVRHPETEVSSEVINHMLENYIRWYCSYNSTD